VYEANDPVKTRTHSNFRTALLSLTVVAVGISLCLVADALVVSRFLFDPDKANVDIFRTHSNGWYTLNANLDRAPAAWGTTRYLVSTDEYGFRINDMGSKRRRPAGFLFLGDSFTYGITARWSETFVGMFELESAVAAINGAVPSYSPTAYIYQYRRALALNALRPRHVVVVGLDISDVQDEAALWEQGTEHPRRMPMLRSVITFAAAGR
jgi:hypothetical protein